MKKIISALLVCILMVGCVMTFASCGKIILGEYEAEVDIFGFKYKVTYAFEGKDSVTVSSVSSVAGFSYTSDPVTGTYEIGEDADGNATIKFNFGDNESPKGAEKGGVALEFENGKDYIKIGSVTYTKK